MSISVQCPGCQTKLKANDELAGKRVKCPNCAQVVVVPSVRSSSLQPTAPNPSPSKSHLRRGHEATASPATQSRPARWPWYAGGGAAFLCVLAVVISIFAMPGKDRTAAKNEIAAVTPSEPKPELKPEPKPEPTPEAKSEPKPEPTTEPSSQAVAKRILNDREAVPEGALQLMKPLLEVEDANLAGIGVIGRGSAGSITLVTDKEGQKSVILTGTDDTLADLSLSQAKAKYGRPTQVGEEEVRQTVQVRGPSRFSSPFDRNPTITTETYNMKYVYDIYWYGSVGLGQEKKIEKDPFLPFGVSIRTTPQEKIGMVLVKAKAFPIVRELGVPASNKETGTQEKTGDGSPAGQSLRPGGSGSPATDKKAAESPDFSKTPGGWPALSGELNGSYEVRVKNPNDFKVRVGLRSEGKGKDFVVPANQSQSVKVPNGKYDVYFHYSTDPDGLYQGDAFTLKTNGVEIQIVKVVGGNYGIRKVK